MQLRTLIFVFVISTVARAQTQLEQFTFEKNGVATQPQSDALVVVKEHQTVLEKYARGYTAKSRHIGWSLTKSITATLVGMAIERGWLKLTDSVCVGQPLWMSNSHCKITIEDLLNWSSGLQWNESAIAGDRATISTGQMLAGPGQPDMFRYILNLPLAHPPGTFYSYSTGDSTALMGALKNAAPDKNTYDKMPWDFVFDPLQMSDVTFERDATGMFVGGALMYVTPNDLIKFGEFYLADGVVNGQRLLPMGWREWLTSPNPNFKLTADYKDSIVPLRHFKKPTIALTGEIPADTYMAVGMRGQYLVIIPSLNLLAVRLGDDQDKAFDISQFLRLLIQEYAPPAFRVQSLSVAKKYDDMSDEPDPLKQDFTPASLMNLGTHLISHMYCSCRFVTGQSDQFCREMVSVSPNVFRISTDEKKSVWTSVAGMWRAQSEYQGERFGCL